MAGSPLETFNDFVATTGPRYLTSAQAVINDAVLNTYIMSRFLRGRSMDKVIQGGKKINDVIRFDDGGTYGHYQPNETFTYTNPQTLTTLEIDWRFSVDYMTWTDHEVELNIDDGLTSEAQAVRYKRLKWAKEQQLWTSIYNGFEADLWANPFGNSGQMETSTGRLPYSIPSFITEDTTNFHANDGAWSTIMGVNPANEERWRNQVSLYDYDDAADTDGDRDGLINAFDDQWLKVRFTPPGSRNEYFEKPNLNRQFICCSRGGMNMYKDMLRASNDTLVSKQDPAYNNPVYSGVDLLYVAQMDTATIFDDGANGGATELNASTDGYRFYWINGNYMCPIFHSRRYFKKHKPMNHPNQPFTWVCLVDCWWNLFLNSRRRHGIVAPQ